MVSKSYNKKKTYCKVTFRHKPVSEVQEVQILGDFNEWGTKKKQLLKKRKDGTFSLTLSLKSQADYQYRFLVDGAWVTDTQADAVVWNTYGSQNAQVCV